MYLVLGLSRVWVLSDVWDCFYFCFIGCLLIAFGLFV